MRVVIRFQRQSKIAPRDGIVRHEFRSQLEFVKRVSFIPASPQCYAETLMRWAELRVDRDSLPELSGGFFRPTLLPECDAIVVARLCVLGALRKAFSELSDSLRRLRVLKI